MKNFLIFSVLALLVFTSSAQNNSETINLNGRICTLTNMQGRVFRDVELRYATANKLIYSRPEGGGSISLTNLSSSTLQAFGIPTNQATPKVSVTAQAINRSAQEELKKEDFENAVVTLNQILIQFPTSHEATTIRGLIRFLREKDKNKSGLLTVDEARSLKKLMDTYSDIAKNYNSISSEKREALDAIFGPATFTRYNFDLDAVLNALTQLDAARSKALSEPN